MRQLLAMRKFALLLAVATATCAAAKTGYAQNNRTFVSNTGLAGNTSAGCSASSPCDTFANALSVTNDSGEINCLNAGDFGTVTINKTLTINCEGVSNGGIQVGSGGFGVTVSASNINVSLIGLDINGEGVGGDGVIITAAAHVNIRNCKVYGFTDGQGILLQAGTLVVDNTLIANNDGGLQEDVFSGISNMTVRNSNINNNNYGIFVRQDGGTHAGVTVEQTTISFNRVDGVTVQNSGAIAVIGGSTVVNNTVGISQSGGGIVYSAKNNQIYGNGTDGTPLTAYPGYSGGGA